VQSRSEVSRKQSGRLERRFQKPPFIGSPKESRAFLNFPSPFERRGAYLRDLLLIFYGGKAG
jgi:hypothetical protein